MAKTAPTFRCGECDARSPRWVGRCPGCGGWNTVVEDLPAARPATAAGAEPVPITDVGAGPWAVHPTGLPELDRVLGGGLVPGSVTLLGGEPGTGKSTLVLQMLSSLARQGHRCLAISAEESSQQVRQRAERLGALEPNLWLLAETSVPAIVAALEELAPAYVAVDSIQSVHDPEVAGGAGSVPQVRDNAQRLVTHAKHAGVACVLVGHVTKEGTLAGPRLLEHVVDTVLSFEGDRHHALRLLRAAKHRFGSTHEVGLFELGEHGLVDVPDASGLFLADRRAGVPGSAVVPTIEGHRPLVVEVQALVVPPRGNASPTFPARRSVQGLDPRRVALLLAVLERRARLSVGAADVYASALGGVRVVEPGADLPLALAMASSLADRPLPGDLVACGEVGLGGELRQVSQLGRRLAEAARLGFRRALVPRSVSGAPPGLELLRAGTIGEALDLVGLAPTRALASIRHGDEAGVGAARGAGPGRARTASA